MAADIEKPLTSEDQRFENNYGKNYGMSSPSVIDALGSARSKIYALYQLLNHLHFESSRQSEAVYSLQFKAVKPSHQVSQTEFFCKNFVKSIFFLFF